MINGIVITIRKPAYMSVRAYKEATRKGFKALGEYWFENMLDSHFEPGAERKYNYRPRSADWIKGKTRGAAKEKNINGGAHVANVWTGRMRDALTRYTRVRAFPTRATLIMVGPPYIKTRHKPESNQPNKAAEVTRVTTRQSRELSRVLRATVEKEFNRHRPAEEIKI